MKSRNLKSNITELAILVFFIAGVFSIIMYLISQRDPNYPIDSDKFIGFTEVNKPIIVDLRESSEIIQYPLNYQPLIHYPFLELQKDISKLNLEISKTYLFVCTDGNRARLINSNFSAKGIITYYLKDGLWGVPQKQLEQLKEITD